MSDRTEAGDRATARTDGGWSGVVGHVRAVADRVRTDPEETDARLTAVEGAERRSVTRHSLGNRICHWLQTALFVVLLWTGLAIWTGYYLVLERGIWGGYYVAFGLHMWAGILMVAVSFVLFPYYYVYVDGHHQLPGLTDIQVGVAILEAFAGLREYLPHYHEARRTYDEGTDDWIAHHPAQKGFFWGITALLAVLALTGFGMFRVMVDDPAWWVAALGVLETWLAFELLKQVHLLAAFLSTAMVVFHVYFAVLPGNWDVLRSMVVGDMEGYVLRGDRAEGSDDQSAGADGATGGAEGDD